MDELSIVIPCYNEEKVIQNTLQKIEVFLLQQNLPHEVIVVDDGSTDATVSLVASFTKHTSCNLVQLSNPTNLGKGAAVKKGMLHATKSIVLFMDADSSTAIDEVLKMQPHLNQYPVVIASRNLPQSVIPQKQPLLRQFSGKTFAKLVNLAMGFNIKDTQCGFKLFTASATKEIFSNQKTSGFAFDIEILAIALKQGYEIKEVPITWINDSDSKVNLIKDSFRMFHSVLKIRKNLRKQSLRPE